MKQFFSLLLFALVLSTNVNAQISHDLEIYSEDGLNFTLIVNGRKMSEESASNIQILNTDKDYVQVKIIFDDQAIPPIEKKYLQLADPASGTEKSPVTVVYKIVEKKGNYKLKFASRSFKKIQNTTTEVIIIEASPQPVNGKIIINW